MENEFKCEDLAEIMKFYEKYINESKKYHLNRDNGTAENITFDKYLCINPKNDGPESNQLENYKKQATHIKKYSADVEKYKTLAAAHAADLATQQSQIVAPAPVADAAPVTAEDLSGNGVTATVTPVDPAAPQQ